MSRIILTAPVKHNGDKLVAGDPIDGLTDKEAQRLVDLGFAKYEIRISDPLDVKDDEPDADRRKKIAEQAAGMKKDDLLAELKEGEVVCSRSENLNVLREKYIDMLMAQAGIAESTDAAQTGSDESAGTSEEEKTLLAFSRDELIAELKDANVKINGPENIDVLRDKLRKAWEG